MKQQKTKYSKRINLTIIAAVMAFCALFSFSLQLYNYRIAQADQQYYNELNAKLDSTNSGAGSTISDADQAAMDDAIIYNNFYDLADAVEKREAEATSYKYTASGNFKAVAKVLDMGFNFQETLSYSRATNQNKQKLFVLSAKYHKNNANDLDIEQFGTLTFTNQYYYNPKTDMYRYIQYLDPAAEESVPDFLDHYNNVDIVRNMFTINSSTIESVESFNYDPTTQLYTVEATINKTTGTNSIRTFIRSILQGDCKTSASRLKVKLTIRKDYVITKAEYDTCIRVSMSGNGLSGYAELDGVMTENLIAFNDSVVIRATF